MDDSKKNITDEYKETENGGAEYYDHGNYSGDKQFNDDEDFDDFDDFDDYSDGGSDEYDDYSDGGSDEYDDYSDDDSEGYDDSDDYSDESVEYDDPDAYPDDIEEFKAIDFEEDEDDFDMSYKFATEKGFYPWLMRNWSWLLAVVITFIFMVVCMIIGKVAPFGPNSYTYVDSVHQFVPFFSDFQQKLKEGESLWFTFDIGLGVNFQSLVLYYMGCPLNFLVGLLGRGDILGFMSSLISLKLVFAAGAFGYMLSRRKDEIHNNLMITAFAVAFALNNYMLGYYWCTMWLDCIMVLPLIVLGLERIIKGKSCLLYVVSLFYCLYVDYYIAFMICMFLVLYFFISQHKSVKSFFISGLKFAGCSLLSAGMAAFSLLTAYSAIMTTYSASLKSPKWEWYGNVFDILKSHLFMTEPLNSQLFDGGANLYCGIFAIILLFIYLLTDTVKFFDKLKRVLFIALMILSMNANLLNYIWHGFHDQYGIPNRFSFVYSFMLLLMGYEAVKRLKKTNYAYVIAATFFTLAFVLCCRYFGSVGGAFGGWLLTGLSAGIAVFEGVLLSLYSAKAKKRKNNVLFTILSIVFMEEILVSAAFGMHSNGVCNGEYYTKYTDEMIELKEEIDNYAALKGQTFYREEMINPTMIDEVTYNNMRSLTTFCSTVRGDTVSAMGKLGFYEGINEYQYKGATPLTDSIFGIRYVYDRNNNYFATNGMWDKVKEYGSETVFENKYALSVGYGVDDDIRGWLADISDDAASLNLFAEKACGVGDIFQPVEPDIVAEGTNCSANVSEYDKSLVGYETKDTSQKISLAATFMIPEDGIYYVETVGNYIKSLDYMLNYQSVTSGRYMSQMFCLGQMHTGDVVSLTVNFSDTYSPNGSVDFRLCRLNMGNFLLAYHELSESQLEVTEFSDDSLKGTVNMKNDDLLFLSIPYDEGWSFKVDGKPAEAEKIAKGFIGLNVGRGQHEIEMKYFPPGLKKGLLISIIALLIFIFVFTPLSRPLRGRLASFEKKEELPEEMETLYKEADEESYSKFVRGKSKSQNKSDDDLDEADEESVDEDDELDEADDDNSVEDGIDG